VPASLEGDDAKITLVTGASGLAGGAHPGCVGSDDDETFGHAARLCGPNGIRCREHAAGSLNGREPQ
jgi:hypothetical protein